MSGLAEWRMFVSRTKWKVGVWQLQFNGVLQIIQFLSMLYEPRHDKTNKLRVCPAKTRISLISPLSAWRKLGSLATHWAHSEDWSDMADAQADLSLHWAHNSFCLFCHVAAHIIGALTKNQLLYKGNYVTRLGKHLSQLMRLWHFSSAVNSFCKRACAAIQWG